MAPIRIALVGVGKIARDQHLPAIAANPDFALTAVVSLDDPGLETPYFSSLERLLAQGPGLDAIVLCTPPQVRRDLAAAALARGLHVFLEKPPGATLSEVDSLQRAAERRGVSLFAAWHSRHAAGVELAKAWLAGRAIRSVRIIWREDVRVWHPRQAWIWEAGGLGVFDPGINALSIVTKIMPQPVFVAEAELLVPSNAESPIAATLRFAGPGDLTAEFDWRQTGGEVWEITVKTASGKMLVLSGGGSRLAVDGVEIVAETPAEYQAIYRHFAELLASGQSHVDARPFELVADAFLLGRRVVGEAFHD